jgi:hypothetical protein
MVCHAAAGKVGADAIPWRLREPGEPAIPFVGYPEDIVMSQYSPESAERIIETPVDAAHRFAGRGSKW